jgi:HEPN domain-containing protein
MKGPAPHARWETVEGWLEAAEQDRGTAVLCLSADTPLRGSAAFHCQQAVEKLLKGFLMLAGKRSRKTHSLAQLGAAAEGSFPEVSDLVAAAKERSRWAVDFRYPTRRGRIKPAPDENELRHALAVIDELTSRLRSANPEPATGNPQCQPSLLFGHARLAQTLDEPIGIGQPFRAVRHGAVPGPELRDRLARGAFQGEVPLQRFAGFRLSPGQGKG